MVREYARVRRMRLLMLMLARGRALTLAQIRWLTERDPILSPCHLRGDLVALLELGLVTRCSGSGKPPDYAASLAARRTLRP